MRIINAHVHMIDLAGMARKYPNLSLPVGISIYEDLAPSLALLEDKTLLAQMDQAGIETSILYAVDAPLVYASNEYVGNIVKMHPDRLIGFASVDPLAPDAPQQFQQAVEQYDMKGLKLHPPLQSFSPDDPRVFGLYEKALQLNLPVVFHVGSTPFGPACRLAHANPLLLDEVACTFPDLRIMLTHLGTLWHNEAFMVVEKNPNCFIDTSAYLYEIPQILDRNLLSRLGPDKVIFGTDYPTPFSAKLHEMKDYVQCIQSLDLDPSQKEAIFSGNIQKLLKGPEQPAQRVTVEDMANLAREKFNL